MLWNTKTDIWMFSHYKLLLHFCTFFEIFLLSVCHIYSLSPFVGTQKCYFVVHNKILFCAALGLLKYWVTVNYKCYKVQRLTPDSGTNKKWKKHDTQWSCNLRLRRVFYYFYSSIFARKAHSIFPCDSYPLSTIKNPAPATLHTKEFESTLR